MKTIKLFSAVLLLFMAINMHAQVSVSVNIGTPPMWGPVGYSSVQYYYLPDVEAYYDVRQSMFIYYSGGAWIHRVTLPSQYRSYDLYGGYKVVMTDYHGHSPYANFKQHKMKYGKGYRGPGQKTIGERPGKGGQNGKNYRDNGHGTQSGKHDNYNNKNNKNNNKSKGDDRKGSSHGNGGGKGQNK